ncbi:MAG TPA: peptidylprolyl isomerase [Coleofasciculaceae cyanobacterium]|jgi:cyclophilin family peptidyl-prolyl cis-trans isomerase
MKRINSQRKTAIALSLVILVGLGGLMPGFAEEKNMWNPKSWFVAEPTAEGSAAEAMRRADEAQKAAELAEKAAREARIMADKARQNAESVRSVQSIQAEQIKTAPKKPIVMQPEVKPSEAGIGVAPAFITNKTGKETTPNFSEEAQQAEAKPGIFERIKGGGWNPMSLLLKQNEGAEAVQAQAAIEDPKEARQPVEKPTRQSEETPVVRQAVYKQEVPKAEALESGKTETPASTEAKSNGWALVDLFKRTEEKTETHQQAAIEKTEVANPSEPTLKTKAILVETEKGNIAFELYPDEAPLTVANFVKLVNEGFYNRYNMKFHRVIPGFVVQTGDPTSTGAGGSKERVPLEAKNKLTHNAKGVVAMARGADPNSATSQFYITLAPQSSLDGKYAIFGRVISGMDALEKIEKDDMLYGVRLVELSSVKRDAEPDKKNLFSKLF